ncbi:MAG: glycosyltransferase family 9 protein [Nitrospirae bacterium]|nr:glycosyltransferase family 9 protein [Nitrospirota bacterium]
MKINPIDGFLYAAMRILKFLDRRSCDLRYFDPDKVKSILLISTTAIGDTLLSTPAIKAIRTCYPKAKIISLFNVKNIELFSNNPYIDIALPYYGGYKGFLKTVKTLRRYSPDVALILHGNEPQATPLAYLSHARFIVKVPRSREYDFLLSNTSNGFRDTSTVHACDLRLQSASFIKCDTTNKHMTLVVEEKDRATVRGLLRGIREAGKKMIVGFQPGAADTYKMWPESRFIELGKRLLSQFPNVSIVITGSKDESSLCETIAREIGSGTHSFAGVLTLRQTAALVKELDLLVTNDTGIMHIAIALGVKTVSMFCPTDHHGIGAIYDRNLHRIVYADRPCKKCTTKKCSHPYCMDTITVDEVFRSVLESIGVG